MYALQCKEFGFTEYSEENMMRVDEKFMEDTGLHIRQVATYNQWKKHGRQVKRGEHGYKMKAPCYNETNEHGKPSYYRRFTVFDVSQTEPVSNEDKLVKTLNEDGSIRITE